MQKTRCYMLGERAVVLELAPPVSLESQQRIWYLSHRVQSHDAIRDVIPGMNNLTLLLHDAPADAQQAIDQLNHWWQESEAQVIESRVMQIPVIYGGEVGPDLTLVAENAGMSVTQVVELHSSRDYDVFFIGFQPGFPYLAGLDPRLHMPRRAEPRVVVPAGSVGIGGSQTGVYPLASPGGWQLIGQTQLALFTPQQQPPTLLHPGDKVRFVPQKEGIC